MSSLPLTGVFNDGYIAGVYESYRRDPSSVDESWRQFFRVAEQLAGGERTAGSYDASLLRKAAAAAELLGAIQKFGHLAVQLDPLGSPPPGAVELKPEFHGITDADLHQLPGSVLRPDADGTAADVIQAMRDHYCGALAYEFEHISEDAEREWFRAQIESGNATAPLSDDEKKALLQRLTEVDGLERFLGRAYVNVKRFSIEGIDTLVPMLDEAIAGGVRAGAKVIVIGMAHRGRLNVLTHVMGKPYRALLEEFEGRHPATNAESDTGDVKYHKGYRGERTVSGAGPVGLELVPNPSHLEVVNPVVAGVARARQRVVGGAPDARNEATALPSSCTATRRSRARGSFRKL
jgi:2-oxoglutarate dehydrogenase E1 component